MNLKNILSKGFLGLALACYLDPKKIEEMVEVDVGMAYPEFVGNVINFIGTPKETASQINYNINGVPFILISKKWRDSVDLGTEICVRPSNSKGFYARIYLAPMVLYRDKEYAFEKNKERGLIRRWDDSKAREYAQKECEKLEAMSKIN